MVKAKKFIYAREFDGAPKETDFRLEEEELPSPQEGEILVQAVFLSVDPYMKSLIKVRGKLGGLMIGGQVAKIIESRNPKFPARKYIYGSLGWRSHAVFNPDTSEGHFYLVPDLGDLPVSLALGSLGMPGNTAYFGLLEVCQPKAGETLVVSAAAGAVGSLVGQIGKIKGLKVVGIAGSDEKCAWLTRELGFDHAINYKKENLDESLRRAAPEGVDCYFDNVGGETASIVIHQMRMFGRIAVCGSISMYNARNVEEITKIRDPQRQFISFQLEQRGFSVHRFQNRFTEGTGQMLQWIREGKIKYRETVVEGFENMPKAFIGVLSGENIGKMIVKA